MRTVAFINLKGGTGKTVSAANFAHILAAVHHKRVLLVDADKQGSASRYFSVYGEHDGTAALLLADALDTEDVERVIYRTGYAGLDIITSNLDLYAADDVLIPIRPDEFSFSGLLDLVEQVDTVRESVNPRLTIRGAFFTHWQNRPAFTEARDSLAGSGICPVFQTAITYNPKVSESTLAEKPLCVFAPRSWAAIQYKRLTAEYLGLTDSDKGVKRK